MAAELYVIEKVVKKRVLKSGKVQYLVKWKGYSIDHSSWVDAAVLSEDDERVIAFRTRKYGDTVRLGAT